MSALDDLRALALAKIRVARHAHCFDGIEKLIQDAETLAALSDAIGDASGRLGREAYGYQYEAFRDGYDNGASCADAEQELDLHVRPLVEAAWKAERAAEAAESRPKIDAQLAGRAWHTPAGEVEAHRAALRRAA